MEMWVAKTYLISHFNNAIGIREQLRFGSHNCVTENSLHNNDIVCLKPTR